MVRQEPWDDALWWRGLSGPEYRQKVRRIRSSERGCPSPGADFRPDRITLIHADRNILGPKTGETNYFGGCPSG
jgi:hypothetical protein